MSGNFTLCFKICVPQEGNQLFAKFVKINRNLFMLSINFQKIQNWVFRTLMSLLQVKLNERIIATSQGLLIRSIQDSDQGLYHCIATENSFKQTIAKINFKVLNSDMVAVATDKWSPWTWASSVRALSFHPKDLMGAFSHSEMQMINQYCKDTRQQHQHAEESQKMRGDYGKLKALINSRKSRNRRNQLPES